MVMILIKLNYRLSAISTRPQQLPILLAMKKISWRMGMQQASMLHEESVVEKETHQGVCERGWWRNELWK
jgi:hypothetical protein